MPAAQQHLPGSSGSTALCYAGGEHPAPALQGVLLEAPSTLGRPPRPCPRPRVSFHTFSAGNCEHIAPSSSAAARLPLPTSLTRVPPQVLGVKVKLGCRRETSRRGPFSWK